MTCEMLNGDIVPFFASVHAGFSPDMSNSIHYLFAMVFATSASSDFGATQVPLRIEGTFEWEKQINLTCVAVSMPATVPVLRWAVNYEEVFIVHLRTLSHS